MITSIEQAKNLVEEAFQLAGYTPEYLHDTQIPNAWIIPVHYQVSARAQIIFTDNKYYDFRIYRQLLNLQNTGMVPETSEKLFELMLNCYHHRTIRCSLYENSLWVSAFVFLNYENAITLKNLIIDFIKAYAFYEKELAALFGESNF